MTPLSDNLASEILIRETLESMKGKMTLIIITHREAHVALADEVFQIQNRPMTSANQTDLAAA